MWREKTYLEEKDWGALAKKSRGRKSEEMTQEELENLKNEYQKMLDQIDEYYKINQSALKKEKKENAPKKKKSSFWKHLCSLFGQPTHREDWGKIRNLVEERIQQIDEI